MENCNNTKHSRIIIPANKQAQYIRTGPCNPISSIDEA